MSFWLWNKLPDGLLKMKQGGWSKLDYGVKLLISKLAREQGYKCAHCDQTRGLEIEHDHYPVRGPQGPRYTIYNVRGLVCHGCNRDIGMYEAEERGGSGGWSDHIRRLSDSQYQEYIYLYECRVGALIETEAEEQLEPRNFWRRRLFLLKFDDWRQYRGKYPWYRAFEEIKLKRYGIRTPKQLLRFLAPRLRYVEEEQKKNPEYQPPDWFLKFIFDLKPLFDSIQPIVEATLRANGDGPLDTGVS
jgi:hypothetical protein